MGNFQTIFGDTKPVIAMVHLGALPGAPLYDTEAGVDGLVAGTLAGLNALQAAGIDAVFVSGQITGEAAALSDLEAVKTVLPDTPVLANTGVKHDTISDANRAADFMERARAAGGGA